MGTRILDFSNTRLSFRRPLLSYSKVQQVISGLIRNKRAFMNLKQPGLYLDVGCGPNTKPQNINLDWGWHPGIDICCDVTKGLPLPDNYVRGIFTEHCLEHLSFASTLKVLREFHRVAMPGRYLRIVVPDFEIYVDRYDEFRSTGSMEMPYGNEDAVEGIYSPAMSVNRIFREWGHQFIYDFATLKDMLKAAGFVSIRKTKFGESCDQLLLLDSPWRAVESLYVEAKKPEQAAPPLLRC